jgi:hypothetical protein
MVARAILLQHSRLSSNDTRRGLIKLGRDAVAWLSNSDFFANRQDAKNARTGQKTHQTIGFPILHGALGVLAIK